MLAALAALSWEDAFRASGSSKVQAKAGGRFVIGLCCFHEERTPSLHGYYESERFICYGCQRGGSKEDFARIVLGLDFDGTDHVEDFEAIRRWARRVARTTWSPAIPGQLMLIPVDEPEPGAGTPVAVTAGS